MAAGSMDRALAAYREAVQFARSDEFAKVGAFAAQGLALANVMTGDLDARATRGRRRDGRRRCDVADDGAAVALRLAYLRDEPAPMSDSAIAEGVELAFRSGETQNVGLLSGSLAPFTKRPAGPTKLRRCDRGRWPC